MKRCAQLFLIFAKIGLFTLGLRRVRIHDLAVRLRRPAPEHVARPREAALGQVRTRRDGHLLPRHLAFAAVRVEMHRVAVERPVRVERVRTRQRHLRDRRHARAAVRRRPPSAKCRPGPRRVRRQRVRRPRHLLHPRRDGARTSLGDEIHHEAVRLPERYVVRRSRRPEFRQRLGRRNAVPAARAVHHVGDERRGRVGIRRRAARGRIAHEPHRPQERAAAERAVADGLHAIRHDDLRKGGTSTERTRRNDGKSRRERQSGKRRAAAEHLRADTRHAGRYADHRELDKILERSRPDVRHRIRQIERQHVRTPHERLLRNLPQSFRPRNAHQRSTFRKHRIGHPVGRGVLDAPLCHTYARYLVIRRREQLHHRPDAKRHRHVRQPMAVREHPLAYISDARRNRRRHHPPAVRERAPPNVQHAVRQRHARQHRAVRERPFANLLQRPRQRQPLRIRAVAECLAVHQHHALRQVDVLYPRTVPERPRAHKPQRRRELHRVDHPLALERPCGDPPHTFGDTGITGILPVHWDNGRPAR